MQVQVLPWEPLGVIRLIERARAYGSYHAQHPVTRVRLSPPPLYAEGSVAQLVEHPAFNRDVAGASPAGATPKNWKVNRTSEPGLLGKQLEPTRLGEHALCLPPMTTSANSGH